ncbi:MAG: phosphatidate cytidylyltransferase [Candidatus Puniceispirillaceae bacterium]
MSGDLKKRLLGIMILLPLIIGVIAGDPFTSLTITIIQGFIAFELARLVSAKQAEIFILTLLFWLTAQSFRFPADWPILQLLFAASILTVYVRHQLFATIFAGIVIICLVSLTIITSLPEAPYILVSLAVVIMASDSGAYLVGRRLGGPKLAPMISPGKTISGAIGGLVASVITGYFVADYIAAIHPHFVVSSLVIGVLGQIGDLYESYFKRRLSVKDSSNLIPGHGGFLDRFDGYLFILPLFCLVGLV